MAAGRHRTLLPHALAAIYGLAIAYASLQPFAPWIAPAPHAPFWPFAPWPLRWTRFDVIANVIAYLPFGIFVALTPRRATPRARATLAVAAGLTLSFVMETLQMFMPPRDASLVDLAANTCGALLGGMAGASLVHAERTRHALSDARHRIFVGGRLGDVGLALLALWLVVQVNPGIPLFALTFDAASKSIGEVAVAATVPDTASVLIEAAGSALQLIGVGLFLTLLLRERRYVVGAVLLLIGTALLAKGLAAMLVLKPAVWETWLKPGVSIGIAAGLLVLLFAVFLPRAAQVATCAIALLASLLLPVLVVDVPSAQVPVTLFNWRYGHLLNFNGLTQTVLLLWPIAAAVWLFALAGRPRWGEPERGCRL
ncbi:MAG: VanZ family protein [Burkholderiales bacterium]|nr:VanZ family protein [Burkholderiales bacterium]